MFHAGAVLFSSVFLLQLLTGPVGDTDPPLLDLGNALDFVGLDLPGMPRDSVL